ncbi:GTP-binding protein [Aphelenchoides avenae]|nr:GTP-binding protein [Aphelenchus avenae]
MTRPLFRGVRGALRLGVAGAEPMEKWDDFPPWRRFFNSWMTHTKGPFVSAKVDDPYYHHYGHPTTRLDANGTRWTIDTRREFNVTLPDETLEHIGEALGLNVSYSRVEVVLSGDAFDDLLDYQLLEGVLHPSEDVDVYVLFVENSKDVAQALRRFVAHDRKVAARHLHATKWAIRKGDADGHCAFDAWKKASDAIERAESSLKSVNWSESELNVFAEHELRSLKPTVYVVNVPREQYIHQDPAFVAATEEWIHENRFGEHRSPVILTSIELEEELAQRNPDSGNGVSSVFDDMLGTVLRYLSLTRFFVLREGEIQAWNIPANTRADYAAGAVFHRPCDYHLSGHDFCTTDYEYFNWTAFGLLYRVDVERADVFARHGKAALAEKDFTVKNRSYRVQDGDVVQFTMLNDWDEWNKTMEGKCCIDPLLN